ncbi:hypothetical protein PCL1606_39720 [Pseudomonas chlororaphis]|uniref:Uncharacterized protein n=1 Tax=Pseudomonas chlororaphis TaxID=587753 RepID=A0A0D5Y291_9PSED|nr:hypothetical protein PCL1606_39720 [Pseudomonas chlororaphis]
MQQPLEIAQSSLPYLPIHDRVPSVKFVEVYFNCPAPSEAGIRK